MGIEGGERVRLILTLSLNFFFKSLDEFINQLPTTFSTLYVADVGVMDRHKTPHVAKHRSRIRAAFDPKELLKVPNFFFGTSYMEIYLWAKRTSEYSHKAVFRTVPQTKRMKLSR